MAIAKEIAGRPGLTRGVFSAVEGTQPDIGGVGLAAVIVKTWERPTDTAVGSTKALCCSEIDMVQPCLAGQKRTHLQFDAVVRDRTCTVRSARFSRSQRLPDLVGAVSYSHCAIYRYLMLVRNM